MFLPRASSSHLPLISVMKVRLASDNCNALPANKSKTHLVLSACNCCAASTVSVNVHLTGHSAHILYEKWQKWLRNILSASLGKWGMSFPFWFRPYRCWRFASFHIIITTTTTNTINITIKGRDRVVVTETSSGLDGPGIDCRWEWDFPQVFRPALKPSLPPVQRVLILFFRE